MCICMCENGIVVVLVVARASHSVVSADLERHDVWQQAEIVGIVVEFHGKTAASCVHA